MTKDSVISKIKRPLVRKKLGTLVVGVLLLILNDLIGLGVDEQTVQWVVALLGTYLLGQGIADIGKETSVTHTSKRINEHD